MQAALADSTWEAKRRDLASAALVIFFILASFAYFLAAIARASTVHFWMDEVLAVSVARQSSIAGILSAIWTGTDFSPPTYHILLHYFVGLFGGGDGLLIWRIPSIIAIYGAALCMFRLVHPRLGPYAAVLAFAMVLNSDLFVYAVQVRQYALLALGAAAALLLWSGFAATRFPKLRALALWAALSSCLALHFYGLIVVAAIGIAELIWWANRKQFRSSIWVALLLTSVVEAALYPLASHLAALNAGDNAAPDYYGQPTFERFLLATYQILLGGTFGGLPIFCAMILLGGAHLFRAAGLAPQAPSRGFHADRRDLASASLSELQIVILVLCLIPSLAFTLSVFVTHSFSARYASSASLVSGLLIAYALHQYRSPRVFTLVIMALLVPCILTRSAGRDGIADALASLETPRSPLPVVVGEGLLFIELMEAADPTTRSALVYLTRPPGSPSPDPTNENEVKRLSTIRPDYRVSAEDAFLAANPRFYVLVRPNGSIDMTTPSLLEQGLFRDLLSERHGTLLLRAGRHEPLR